MKSLKNGSLSICLVTFHDFPEGVEGGEERFLEYFSHFLAAKNIRVTIISSAAKTKTQEVYGVGIRQFRLPFLGLTPFLLLFSIAAALKIILMHKRRNFSLIHSMDTGYGGIAGLLASKILRLHFFVHSHCKRSYLLKLTLLSRSSFTRSAASMYESFEVSIDKLVTRNADLVIAVSHEIENYIRSLGVPSERIVVSPMGLDIAAFEPQAKDRDELLSEFGIPQNAFVIGYIGSLVKPKGIFLLVKAFSLLQNRAEMNPYLLIVGDGEHGKEMESMVKKMRLRSVVFPGFRKDVARVLAAMDVFVLPSLSEGCPFSLLEAMAAGKAIIASDIPSIKEIVEDRKEAILIDPNESEMLEKAILRIYSNHELRDKLSKNAKKKADHYNMDTCFTQIVKLYTDYEKVN